QWLLTRCCHLSLLLYRQKHLRDRPSYDSLIVKPSLLQTAGIVCWLTMKSGVFRSHSLSARFLQDALLITFTLMKKFSAFCGGRDGCGPARPARRLGRVPASTFPGVRSTVLKIPAKMN